MDTKMDPRLLPHGAGIMIVYGTRCMLEKVMH